MKNSTTIASACQQVKNFINQRQILIGVGNISPWQVEGNPPEVDPTLISLPELQGFVPVATIHPVYQHPKGNIKVNGVSYFIQESLEIPHMVLAVATHVYLVAYINHSLLPFPSYRSLGIYTDVILDMGEITNYEIWIEKEKVKYGVLDTVINCSKVDVQRGLIHKVELLRSFY